MRGFIVVVVLIIVVFFAAPMVAEGTDNSCQALERHVVKTQASAIAGGNTNSPVYNTVNNTAQAGANGQVASTMMAENHPQTPTPVSCTYFWWKSLFQ